MKVTVGIPCYTAAQWIAQAIQSALDQQGVEIEVIVVDDGSTDGSVAVAQKFGERVKVIEGGHQGANHARNRGSGGKNHATSSAVSRPPDASPGVQKILGETNQKTVRCWS